MQFFEVPVEIELEDLMRAYELHVPTERGGWVEVNVLHNLVRRTYEVEFSDELLGLAPEALTATVQLVMLEVQAHASKEEGALDVQD